jgi:hypothetical protein
MSCLTDVEVQAIADGEATNASREHAAACASCQGRVDERRAWMRDMKAAVEKIGSVPANAEARLSHAMSTGSAVRGSTVLRRKGASAWPRAGWMSAFATAAVVAVVVFLVLPRLGAPTRLSASQVLERSLQTLSKTTGVESLEYEIAVDGTSGGPFRITQLIDRANPNHYRIASYGADGVLRTAISQDPARHQRTQLVQVDGRNYIVRIAGIREPVLSLPQMAQALLESIIGMMQATSDPTLTQQDTPAGSMYVVETPRVTSPGSAATLDLQHARIVISAGDFRIHEFEAAGTLLRQPFSVSARLLQQNIVDGSSANFAIEAGPDDVVLDGLPGEGPIEELLTTIVRELRPASR